MTRHQDDIVDQLNFALRKLYAGYSHLSKPQILERMQAFLATYVDTYKPDSVNSADLMKALAESFGNYVTHPAHTKNTLDVDEKTHANPQPDCLPPFQVLLDNSERNLPPAEQLIIVQKRLHNAGKTAEKFGLNLRELLMHLDSILSGRNSAFETALTHSFWKIISHLNPRQAEKLGVPIPADLRVDHRRDPERMSRLVDYIRCGRLTQDTAQHYRHELHKTVFPPR